MFEVLSIVSAAISVILAVCLFMAVRNNSQFRADVDEAFNKLLAMKDEARDSALVTAQLTADKEQLKVLLEGKIQELDAEQQALKRAEEQRDVLIKALEAVDDPHGLAAAIDTEVKRLQNLPKARS